MSEEKQIWKPFPKQEMALLSPAFETLFGGSRGPGKTETGLVWLTYDTENPRYRALVIRRNAEDLSDWVDRAIRFYSGMGAKIVSRPAIITFPSGAIIRTGHLKDDQAYTKYQGHEYQRILIEELTQIPDEKRYLQLIASCRSTVKGLEPRIFLTTNPGGVGHQWVKKRFVDPAPPNTIFRDKISGRTRIFIPATLDDNPVLNEIDPDYIKQLDALKDNDYELYKAWRHGDWNTFAGQFFKEFRTDLHVCPPFIPKKGLYIVGGMDWGRTRPFAFYLTALQKKVFGDVKFHRAWTFFEVTGTDKTPKEWAEIIKEKMKFFDLSPDIINSIQADPAIFTKGQDNSISIADQFLREGIRLKPGSNDRIGGWENMHNWLSIAPDGAPYWMITENCHELITNLPSLVHDENRVEDVDTEGPDDQADAIRYALKSLKWIDAKAGGVGKTKETTKKIITTAVTKEGRQVAINLDKFAQAEEKLRKRVYYK
jgi:phage terminase large subunit